MEKWQKMTFMVAFYMFLIEIRPLEPFMTAYLTGPDGNISLSEVANTLESIKSYSALFGTILMLTTADYLLYKPNIIFLTLWTCLSYLLMTSSPSLIRLRVATVGVGVMYSSSIMSISYLYAQISDVRQFQMATGIFVSALQLGRVVGNISAQLIVNVTGGIYTILPYCNVFTLFLALIWSSFFPPVKRKNILPNKNVPNESSVLLTYDTENKTEYYDKKMGNKLFIKKYIKIVKTGWNEMQMNFKTSYSNPILLKNSFFFIVGFGSYVQILANINVLYSYVVEKSKNDNVLLNGFAESMVTFFGAAGAYTIGKVKLDWTYYSDMFTAFCSTIMGGLMLSCYFCDHLYYIYVLYILFSLVFQSHYVIIYAGIAKELNSRCYSLILEFNYFLSLVIVSIMTLFLIQFNFMNITIPGRFLFFGGLYLILGVVFLFISIFNCGKIKNIVLAS